MSNPEFHPDSLGDDYYPEPVRPVPAADMGGTPEFGSTWAGPSRDVVEEIMAPPMGTEPGTNTPLPEIDYDPLEPPLPRQPPVFDEMMAGDDCIDTEADLTTMRLRLVHVASVLGPLLAESGEPFTAGEHVQRAVQLAEDFPCSSREEVLALAPSWRVADYDTPIFFSGDPPPGRTSGFVVVTPEGALKGVETNLEAAKAWVTDLSPRQLEIWNDPMWLREKNVEPHSIPMLSRSINAYVRSLGIPPEAFA